MKEYGVDKEHNSLFKMGWGVSVDTIFVTGYEQTTISTRYARGWVACCWRFDSSSSLTGLGRCGRCMFQRRDETTLVGVSGNDFHRRIALAIEEQSLEWIVILCLMGEEMRLERHDVKVNMTMFCYR